MSEIADSGVHLTGLLRCRDATEAATVREQLPAHLALTRAEDGCIRFEVVPTEDPLVWRVEERFRDRNAFVAHQERAAGSEWGRATEGIERDYSVTGM